MYALQSGYLTALLLTLPFSAFTDMQQIDMQGASTAVEINENMRYLPIKQPNRTGREYLQTEFVLRKTF